MIVVDASVVIDLVTDIGRKSPLHDRLSQQRLLGPDILPVEVASGLRGMHLGGRLDDGHLDESMHLFLKLRVDLHPSLPLIPRILALRQNFSAYNASYVALAETFDCPLLTYDRRLAKAAAEHCAVEILPS